MSARQGYAPGPAGGAHVQRREGDTWTLVLVRTLRHAPEKVWRALTDPAELHQWAPFDADGNLAIEGTSVRLSTVGTPSPHVTETTVKRAVPPKLLEYSWAGGDMRWELEPQGSGTRLTLWTNIDRRYIAMGAAGWHVALDVLDHLLGDTPIGRIAGPEAIQLPGWQRLHAEYAKQFKEARSNTSSTDDGSTAQDHPENLT